MVRQRFRARAESEEGIAIPDGGRAECEEAIAGPETVTSHVAASERQKRGYLSLLNLEAQPHWTVFLSDFALPAADVRRLQRQLDAAPTRPLFIRIDGGVKHALHALRSAGINLREDYLSLQGIVCREKNLALLGALFKRLPRRDLAKIDVPALESGFRKIHATQSLGVVMRADYAEQDWICGRFFDFLARRNPYRVDIETSGARLQVRDSRRWFKLAGRLRTGVSRTLPDGEVTYAPALVFKVDGEFVVDGAVLPIAQNVRFAKEALRLLPLSGEVERHPFRLHIRGGKVVRVSGNRRAAKLLSECFEANERYRNLTEVGVSFNSAVTRFIHRWPAASNEVRPGVHLGIGGAGNPDEDDPRRSPMVHIDCIAANCKVLVNGYRFLRASS